MDTAATKLNTKDIAYIGVFAALMAVCSWITIPMPSRIDITLQTLALFLTMGLLGGKRGSLTILVYLLLGLAGLPVFSGFSGGPAALLTPSGGYLIGFLFTALLMWGLERLLGTKTWVLALSMTLGFFVYNIFGTAWFMIVYPMGGETVGLLTALAWCVFPYVPFDTVKIILALVLTSQLRRHVR